MACQKGALRRTEVLDYVVGKLYRRIQQSPASGCPVISDSGLDQVTQAVVFMGPRKLGKPESDLVADVERIQVSARFLGRNDVRSEVLDLRLQIMFLGLGGFV